MNWDYRISRKALKHIQKLGKPASRQLFQYLDEKISGAENPRQWDKELKGELKNLWSFRSGDYRILCQLEDQILIVLVIAVGHRKTIYKEGL